MDKIIRIGICQAYGRKFNTYCRIKFDGGRIAITGVEGPKGNGDCVGSCGQINGAWDVVEYAPGWTPELVVAFRMMWGRWHLNDMRAGTPAQEAHLRLLELRGVVPGPDHYRWALDVLASAGLQPDGGYSYGSKWNTEEVPADVLAFLQSLPDTDKTPAWC